mmetsp:Transcript_11517/g.40711  ORF Transcript_11517/g.40711 Transcript_11517/m.40711 type:complete len:204 (-) Transcript_11517:97-708(-)
MMAMRGRGRLAPRTCAANLPERSAARQTAPAGSTTWRSSVRMNASAREISASSTVTTSRTWRATIGQAWCSPRSFVGMASATVSSVGAARSSASVQTQRRPSPSACASRLPRGSTATTCVRGDTANAAAAIPARRPPPDTGTRIKSKSPWSSHSSSPIVPWPEMTTGSSNGCRTAAPPMRLAASAAAKARAAGLGPHSTTVAP